MVSMKMTVRKAQTLLLKDIVKFTCVGNLEWVPCWVQTAREY